MKIFFLIFLYAITLSAAEKKLHKGLFPPLDHGYGYEIHEIRFDGTEAFSELELKNIIKTRESNRGITHNMLRYYYDNIVKMDGPEPIINPLKKELRKSLNAMSEELSYFSPNIIESDIQNILKELYNMSGYHWAQIDYTFLPDSAEKKNVLTFYIQDSTQAKLAYYKYHGLDTLPNKINSKINSFRVVKEGENFNETRIVSEVNGIIRILKNNGYYFAEFAADYVRTKYGTQDDSLDIFFKPGRRVKIGNITFVDSLNGQRPVSHYQKTQMLDFEEGDWYSIDKIKKSEVNLMSLGVFIPDIDTTSRFQSFTDSTLNFRILNNYGHQFEYGIEPYFNEAVNSQEQEYYSIGIDGSVLFKNFGGAAQKLGITGKFAIKDIIEYIKTGQAEKEYRLSFEFMQPLLWNFEGVRVSLLSRPEFIRRNLQSDFELETFSFPVRFTANLRKFLFIDRVYLDFWLTREYPIDINQWRSIMEDPTRENKFSEYSFRYYEELSDYTNNHFFSSNILGLTFSGDKRNHPLNPTKGHFTSIATDGWNIFMPLSDLSGIARYARFQFAHFHFFSLSKNLVMATKFKAGHIIQLDENSVIPFDRQFFSGGANSVRGWPARQLHYSYRNTQNATDKEDFNSEQFEFDSDIVGSSTMIEGSVEFRYHFSKPTNINSQLADQISSIGFTGFIDFGNAFGWYAESPEKQTTADPIDYLQKLAVSVGFGLRYDTPIGPLRVDVAFPFLGPKIGESNYQAYTLSGALKSPVFYLGLGHAF